MKLGIGLYKHMLNEEHYKFARQCGATHVVIHLVDYFEDKSQANQPIGSSTGWGEAGVNDEIWSLPQLLAIKKEINSYGMELEAIENFDPAHWHDILLDGPKRNEQMKNLKKLIRNVGKAGIPNFGYNFSLAGVSSRIKGEFARGGAMSVGMDGEDRSPVPCGMVWNMIYNPNAEKGTSAKVSREELWNRFQFFLNEIIPVAENAGVKMAAHPDDPPLPFLRGTPRLVYQPHIYQKLLDAKPSASNCLEFCLGSIAEMTEGNVYDATDIFSKNKKIAYIHFRNIKGKVPNYKEVFIDEGDIDMVKILKILRKNKFDGVLIPDHTPLITCDAPWYAGMAFAMGYMKAAIQIVMEEEVE